MSTVFIRMTREEALEQGLLVCTCGHPPNNHFSTGACARCECTKYAEVAKVGKLLKGKQQTGDSACSRK